MAKDLTSLRGIDELAEEAPDQMFGYYSRAPRPGLRAANTDRPRVVSELDAAGAIPAGRHVA